MHLRTLGTVAAGFSLWLGSTSAGEPTKPTVTPKSEKVRIMSSEDKSANQKLADAVAAKLSASDAANDADIEFSAMTGTVSVSGTVASENQKKAILDIVRRVDGVKMVKDGVTVKSSASQLTGMSSPEPMKLMVPPPMPVMATKAVDAKVDNQKLADTVINQLKMSGTVANADLDVLATNGTVSIAGVVTSDAQKKAIMEVIRRVDGVTMVKDGVQVKAMAGRPMQQGVMPVQAVGPYAAMAPSAMPPAAMPGNPQIDPVPVGPGGGYDGAAPPLPQNAWPTYAPYNNVSRVAYPTAYPYNAFPFIGPYYPFPKVPLGWRKVTLEWEDGHWWLGRKQAPIDYWRVKFGY